MHAPRHLIVTGLLTVLVGCPTTSTTPDPDPTPDPTPTMGVDPSVPAGPGEVRGGILPDDPDSFALATTGGISAEARPGDLVLYNDKVRFVVRSEEGHGYVGIAGALIDADIIRPDGQLGRDCLDEAFLSFGIGRIASGEQVELVADGTDGEAVVRVTGRDARWTFVEGVAEAEDPLQPELGLEVVTEYRLMPDRWDLVIESRLTNTTSEVARVNALDGLIASQEDLEPWRWGAGLGEAEQDELPSVGVTGRYGEATLLLFRPEEPMVPFAASSLLSSSGIELTAHGWMDIPPGETAVLRRHRAVTPDPITAEAVRLRTWGVELEAITGEVVSGGAPVAGARVHVVDPDAPAGQRFVGFAVTGDDGTFVVEVPPGSYQLVADGQGPDELVDLPADSGRYGPFTHPSVNQSQLDVLRGDADAVPLVQARGYGLAAAVDADTGDSVTLELPAPAEVTLTLTDGSAPVPAAVSLSPQTPEPSPFDAEWLDGLGLESPSNALRLWLADGSMTVAVPPGDWSVTASSGFRRGKASATGTWAAGPNSVELVLPEVLPLDGWLAMDAHLHGAPSNDSSLSMEERLIGCAAGGIELPVTTDHDRQSDYGPVASALGLDGRMRVIDGVEVSPVLRGHFNLFPVEPLGPSVPNGGAPAWWELFEDTDELMARIRESGGPDALIQVNHGREDSGMMSASNYDPGSGTQLRPSFWSWDFDLVEIVNARSPGYWIEPRADWFSWLNQGQRRVPTGVSDSHGRTAPCGYGRTDVFLDATDPGAVTPEAVRDAIAAGRVVVAGGVTLRVTTDDGERPGGTVTGDSIALQVVVAGPEWVVPEVVRLYRNGELIEDVAVPATSEGGIWWSGTLEDTPGVDSWYVVEVEGSQPLGGPWGGAVPYALANAIFLDRAGDGWEAPGLPAD